MNQRCPADALEQPICSRACCNCATISSGPPQKLIGSARLIQENPDHPVSYRYLAACYAQMGRLDEAREIVVRLRAITPLVVSSADYLRNLEQRELLMSGLRLAAGETA